MSHIVRIPEAIFRDFPDGTPDRDDGYGIVDIILSNFQVENCSVYFVGELPYIELPDDARWLVGGDGYLFGLQIVGFRFRGVKYYGS